MASKGWGLFRFQAKVRTLTLPPPTAPNHAGGYPPATLPACGAVRTKKPLRPNYLRAVPSPSYRIHVCPGSPGSLAGAAPFDDSGTATAVPYSGALIRAYTTALCRGTSALLAVSACYA